MKKLGLTLLMVGAATSLGCGRNNTSNSDILVTDVEHSPVKRQAIGNCWLYASASWAESMHLSSTQETVDLSETYWTWWHWYEQILSRRSIKEISTGGNWYIASSIIQKYGMVKEADFIKADEGTEMSTVQARAESEINQALSNGELADPKERTREKVKAVLDRVFQSNMDEAFKNRIKANEFIADKKTDGSLVSIDKLLDWQLSSAWSMADYPSLSGKETVADQYTISERKELHKRVMRALNDKKPVVLSFMVDFNALDPRDSAFKKSYFDEMGGTPGRQGGHLLVLEDYVVDNVPGVGKIGEGEVSAELKQKALEGDVIYYVVKNSWGTNRPDRGLTDGYNRLYLDYLDAQMPWTNETSGEVDYYTTLNNFILPEGY